MNFRVFVVVLLAICQFVSAETLQGTVVGITGGDTITVLDASQTQHKVRLSGIDAPEKRQAFGNASKAHLSGLVYNRAVQVEYQKEQRLADRLEYTKAENGLEGPGKGCGQMPTHCPLGTFGIACRIGSLI